MKLDSRLTTPPSSAPTRTSAPKPDAETVTSQTDRVELSGTKSVPRETFCDVARALKSAPDVPLEQTYQWTKDFIAAHPFFHHGLMNLPIGGGKHFRNVPFVGPSRMAAGFIEGDHLKVQKGREVTRGTWDAS